MNIEINDTDITDLIIFLGLAKEHVKDIELLPDDEHLRLSRINQIESLLKRFEN